MARRGNDGNAWRTVEKLRVERGMHTDHRIIALPFIGQCVDHGT